MPKLIRHKFSRVFKYYIPVFLIRGIRALPLKLSNSLGTGKLLVVFLLLLALIFLIYPRARLYHLDAETGVVQLKFSESLHNKWLLDGFLLCEPQNENVWFDDIEPQASNDECQEKDFKKAETLISEPILKLHEYTLAHIEWSLKNGLKIELKADKASESSSQLQSASSDKTITMGKTLILYRPADENNIPLPLTLPFEAVSAFGSDVRPGIMGILKTGMLTVYEDSLLWPERYLAGENPLFLGDTIKFITTKNGEDEDLATKGFMRIAANEEGIEQGIHIIAYSGANDINFNRVKAKVFRFGTDGYVFSPSLWTRIENAPDIIFIISIFGILMATIEIASMINRQPEKNSNDENS